jgi:hypothetical protein
MRANRAGVAESGFAENPRWRGRYEIDFAMRGPGITAPAGTPLAVRRELAALEEKLPQVTTGAGYGSKSVRNGAAADGAAVR